MEQEGRREGRRERREFEISTNNCYSFTGVYTFTTTSDDGARLFIDDTLVIDDCCAGHAATDASGDISLVYFYKLIQSFIPLFFLLK